MLIIYIDELWEGDDDDDDGELVSVSVINYYQIKDKHGQIVNTIQFLEFHKT